MLARRRHAEGASFRHEDTVRGRERTACLISLRILCRGDRNELLRIVVDKMFYTNFIAVAAALAAARARNPQVEMWTVDA